MKVIILLLGIVVGFVLWNESAAPENFPWEKVVLPKTELACQQLETMAPHSVKGQWKKASSPKYPFAAEASHAAHCHVRYMDEGKSCTRPDDCQTRLCIVHPVSRKTSCSGYLPPRGRFEFLDSRGWVRDAKLPL